MAISAFELVQVESDFVTADYIIWRRYKNRAPGMVEAMLDANPQLAIVHQTTCFIPAGVFVRVPIDLSLLAGAPTPPPNIWGT